MKQFLLSAVFAAWFLFSSLASAGTYWAGVSHIPQSRGNYCGITVAQMWIGWLLGRDVSQDSLADHIYPYRPYEAVWLNAGDLENLLEDYTDKDFTYHNHKRQDQAEGQIDEELRQQGRPLAIAATTNRSDGRQRIGGHWLLINGLQTSGSGKKRKIEGVFINDPLWRSSFASSYLTLSPNQLIGKDDLFSRWWRRLADNTIWQDVED